MNRSTRSVWFAWAWVLVALAAAGAQTLNFDNLSGTLPAGTTTFTGTVTITGSVTVPANGSVVVAPGTTIRLRDYYLSIFVKGSFTANGTAASPVTITSIDDSGPDQWGGVQYQRGATGTLAYVRFRYGGGYPAAMVCIDSARVSVSNCTFTSSSEDGIRVSNILDPTMVSITNCTFARSNSDGIQCDDASPTVRACSFTNGGGALHLTGTSFPVYSGDLTSNGPPIWVDGTTLSRSGTWGYAGIPYVVTGNVTVPAGVALTVAPGTVVKVTDYYTRFFIYGDLSAPGTTAAPVNFTSYLDDLGGDSNRDGAESAPAPDQWGGLIYYKGATGTLNQARFTYGGGYSSAMVEIDSARVSLAGCSFTRSSEDGIRVRNVPSPSLVAIVGCTFTRNSGDGIECNDASPTVRAGAFVGGGNAMRLTGTSYPAFVGDLTTDAPGIWIDGATMATSGTWSYAGIPYVLSGNVTVPAGVTLTVAPGVIIKATSYYDRFFVYGRLDVPGTATMPVTFTSYQDDTSGDTNRDGVESAPGPDQWGGLIYFRGAAGTLAYGQFAYGGGYSQGMVEVDSARVSLTHCSFQASSEDGLCVRTITDPTWVPVTGCTFTRNSDDGIECNGASPTVRACSFAGGGNAMRLTGTSYPVFGGDLSTDAPGIWINGATMATSGTWSYAGIPYVLSGNVTVPAGVTLTVAPALPQG